MAQKKEDGSCHKPKGSDDSEEFLKRFHVFEFDFTWQV